MVASTVTNNTSAESSWSQLLGARQTRVWHDQEGVTPTCRKGHWKKKQIWQSKVRMQKKINLIFNVLLLWAKCMPINFEIQQGFFFLHPLKLPNLLVATLLLLLLLQIRYEMHLDHRKYKSQPCTRLSNISRSLLLACLPSPRPTICRLKSWGSKAATHFATFSTYFLTITVQCA